MNKAVWSTLTGAEKALVAQTEHPHLKTLDEDEVAELHGRVRRARNKYSTLYRRQASAQVVTDSSRSKASAKNKRTRDKAEVFEDALARTSARLATLARQSAAALRAERLAAARNERAAAAAPPRGSAPARADGSATATKRRGDNRLDSPARKRAAASTRAAGRRGQAKRDSR